MNDDVEQSTSLNSNDSRFSRIVFAFGLLYSLVCLPPWIPSFLTAADLRDPSWMYALHDAFVQGRQFGRDVIFTYGPFGFVTTAMYHPATYALMMAVWCLLAGVFFHQIWRLTGRFTETPISRLGIAAVAVRVAALDVTAFFVSFPVLLLLERTGASRDVETGGLTPSRSPWGLIAAVGFLPLTKFTFVPITGLVLAAVLVVDIAKQRLPITAFTLVGITLGFWCAAGQSLPGIVDYVKSGLEVAAGYEPAMSLWETEPSDIAVVWTAAVVGLLTAWLFLPSFTRGKRLAVAVELFTISALMFLCWKTAFVRFHPSKIAGFAATVFLFATMFLLNQGRRSGSVSRWHWLGLALATVLLAVANYRYESADRETGLGGQLLLPHRQQIAAVLSPITDPGWRHWRHEAACEEIRRQHPLTELSGTVDVIPHKLATVFGTASERYQPRPVWQSYCAYSPRLAALNAAHYRSTDAPEFVLFRVAPLDGRFPAMEDGSTWRVLLERYRFHSRSGDYLVLRKSAATWKLQTIGPKTRATSLGDEVSVPSDITGLLWCRLRVSRTLAGRLAAAGYKLPTISIHVTTAERTQRFRLVPGMAESGFLLSPLIQTTDDFVGLMHGEPRNANTVRSIRVTVDSDSPVAFFEEDITVELERLLPR